MAVPPAANGGPASTDDDGSVTSATSSLDNDPPSPGSRAHVEQLNRSSRCSRRCDTKHTGPSQAVTTPRQSHSAPATTSCTTSEYPDVIRLAGDPGEVRLLQLMAMLGPMWSELWPPTANAMLQQLIQMLEVCFSVAPSSSKSHLSHAVPGVCSVITGCL